MVTGVRADEHGLLTNGTIVHTGSWPPVKVEPLIEKEKMVHVPTVYDAAYAAGLTTAQVDWVAINKARTITWAFSEWASANGPLEREMLAKGVVSASDLQGFEKANILFRDQIWTRAAAYLIRQHQPDLLLFHLLSLDSTHHQYGPNTLAGRAAIAFLDSCVEKIVAAVREAGLADRTTFLIVADHGFKAYTKIVRPGNALDAAEIVSIIFTATSDLRADFPAVAAREMGLSSTPLLCCQEIPVEGAVARCIRILVHCYLYDQTDAHHVYLHGAQGLRLDLPE